jgi:hypothetical protein
MRRGFSTITTNKIRHLSKPSTQQTRQPSMRSPIDTGLNDRRNLDIAKKSIALEQWRSKPRYPHDITDDQGILRPYGVILVDLLVKGARQAGARTTEF